MSCRTCHESPQVTTSAEQPATSTQLADSAEQPVSSMSAQAGLSRSSGSAELPARDVGLAWREVASNERFVK